MVLPTLACRVSRDRQTQAVTMLRVPIHPVTPPSAGGMNVYRTTCAFPVPPEGTVQVGMMRLAAIRFAMKIHAPLLSWKVAIRICAPPILTHAAGTTFLSLGPQPRLSAVLARTSAPLGSVALLVSRAPIQKGLTVLLCSKDVRKMCAQSSLRRSCEQLGMSQRVQQPRPPCPG